MTTISRLARFAVGATLVLVGFGGYTRGSGSGYGCEDRWPLCENGLLGGLLPRADFHMIVEWTHRWIAAMVGLLVLWLVVAAFRRRSERPFVFWLSLAALGVVGLQAWIGRLVVANDLDADLVSVHLGISMTIVALLVAIAAVESPISGARDARWATLVWVGAAGSIGILMLGSYVHNIYISGWPLVGNELVPDLSNRFIAIHWLHRAAAPIVAGYLVWLAVRSARRGRWGGEVKALWAALGLFLVNIGFGGLHVLTKVGSSLLVAGHLTVAAVVWAILVWLAVATTPAMRGA